MIVRLRSGHRPEMGFSLPGVGEIKAPTSWKNVFSDVGKLAVAPIVAPTTLALEAGEAAVGTVGGSIRGTASQIAPLVSSTVGTAGGLVAAVTNPLRPAAGPIALPASSNLPLYIGGGALALVGILLLTRRKAPAS